MYYKLINGNNIVGIANDDSFRKLRNGIVLYSNPISAQFLEFNEKYYRDEWLKPVETTLEIISVEIERIEKEEYDTLYSLYEKEEEFGEIENPLENDNQNTSVEQPDTSLIDYIRETKLKLLSAECNQVIRNGFDITLSDGNTYHFSLEITDQIKIQALALKAEKGQSPLPWHPDNDLCVFYPAEDIIAIYSEMEKMQTYHTTYYNSLKYYINSLENVDDIANIVYGQPIPNEYKSEVLLYLEENEDVL